MCGGGGGGMVEWCNATWTVQPFVQWNDCLWIELHIVAQQRAFILFGFPLSLSPFAFAECMPFSFTPTNSNRLLYLCFIVCSVNLLTAFKRKQTVIYHKSCWKLIFSFFFCFISDIRCETDYWHGLTQQRIIHNIIRIFVPYCGWKIQVKFLQVTQ